MRKGMFLVIALWLFTGGSADDISFVNSDVGVTTTANLTYSGEGHYSQELCSVCEKSISVWFGGGWDYLTMTRNMEPFTIHGNGMSWTSDGVGKIGNKNVCAECQIKYAKSYQQMVDTWWKDRRTENADLIAKYDRERKLARIDQINAEIKCLKEQLLEIVN